MLKLIFLVCVFIPAVFPQCNTYKAQFYFKRSVYEFSTNLMKRLSEENDHHFVTSPLSIWNMLAIISMGASDVTRAEMKQALGLHNHSCFNKKYLDFAKLASSSNKTDVFLERSSVIFGDDSLPIKHKFEEDVTKFGGSRIEKIDFKNLDAAASIINEYVRHATQANIDEIVTPGDLEDIALMVIDALFFKGLWAIPFDITETKVSKFFNEKGNPIGEVNLMSLMDSFKMEDIRLIRARVLELPYGDGERYSMLLFLPFKKVSVYSVIDNLKQISLATIKSIFQKSEPDTVIISLPRFKLTSDLNNLKELLIDMGFNSIFDESTARFPFISDLPLSVSNVVQKADIEVTEDGSTASAASGAGFVSRMAPGEFNAVKPFLFMIIDKQYEIPIFTGAYSKPSLF